MDIVDIPHKVSKEVLEEQILNIFDKRGKGKSISPDHNESCHHISKTKKKQQKNDTVIMKFSQQKDYQQVWQVKKDLEKLKMEDLTCLRVINYL